MSHRQLAPVMAAVLLLTGCAAPATPAPKPTVLATSAPAPVLSEEEAVAAARSTYVSYIRESDDLQGPRAADEAALAPYLLPGAIEEELRGVEEFEESGLVLRGSGHLRAFQLQEYDAVAGTLSAYACLDLSDVRVLDEAGADVTPSTRADLQTSLPQFVIADGTAKLRENLTWSGDSIC